MGKIENIKETIVLNNGQSVEAMAPVVISASRSTDLPAFYAGWFSNRLRSGYAVWNNRFNPKQKIYVSFKNCRVIVFWSKNPAPLIPYLDEIDKKGINYYFQFTLNDYEHEKLEPGVPPLRERIETFKTLSERLGKDRVIWRFDPIIMLPSLTPRDILLKIWNISKLLEGQTAKLVFSFADINIYSKVQHSLIREWVIDRERVLSLEPSREQMEEIAEGLVKIQKAWSEKGWNFELATCAEEIDLSKYGIKHNHCIDADLMKRVFSHDEVLMHYLNYGELINTEELNQPYMFAEFDQQFKRPTLTEKQLKDKGQRKECGCMISKDIGSYNTCPHGCVYCYANDSWKSARKNYNEIKQQGMISESIRFEKIQ